MTANKTTLTIVVEVLDTASIKSVLSQAIDRIYFEIPSGSLTASDGDHVRWSSETTKVEF